MIEKQVWPITDKFERANRINQRKNEGKSVKKCFEALFWKLTGRDRDEAAFQRTGEKRQNADGRTTNQKTGQMGSF